MELSTALLLSLLLLTFLWRKFSRPKSFPPGPLALPILGNILQMDFSNPLKDLTKFSKVYGPVYSIYLGFTPAVVIQGFKDLKEVLVNKGVDFADRPQNRLFEAISGTRGLVSAHYGRAWKEHRRFTLSTLRNFGLGKKSMEERIHEEILYLTEEFRKSQDTLVDPHFVLDNAVSNIICSIVFGRRYDYNDTTFRGILNIVHENIKLATGFWAQGRHDFTVAKLLLSSIHHCKVCAATSTEEEDFVAVKGDVYAPYCINNQHGKKTVTSTFFHYMVTSSVQINFNYTNIHELYNAFGFIKPLPLPHQKIFKNVQTVLEFLGKVLEEHKRTRVPGEPRDYIDSYLDELDTAEKDGHYSTFDAENLYMCVSDLFIAGTETTSASLEWSVLYMMAYPDIQEKCRAEIDKVRGDRDHIDYEDRVRMPYTQAVLQEVQRFASVVPLGAAHAPIKDVQLNGYTIPKGTFIITNLSSVLYDEKHWKYPHEFNPENFLDKNGELVKVEAFLPFSAGPRVCLGENLARMEVFLFFTTMMTQFEFHWPDPNSRPDLTPIFGLTQAPKRFKTMLISRI